MELRDALSQIAEIRQQMARGQLFRGYRAATTAFSGVMAVVTGVVEAVLARAPGGETAGRGAGGTFLSLWVIAAGLCIVVVGLEMVVRTRRSASVVQRQLTMLAVEQFMPSVLAGGLVTWVIWDFFPAQIGMMPGLWMILFSLGVFASARLLPRAVFGAGAFYLLAGIATLIVGPKGPPEFLNLYMGAVFGVGQFGIAGILYLKLERTRE